MEQKRITKKELKVYFQERGVDIEMLFDPNKYNRYTYENYKLMQEAVEHFTEWKASDKGIQFVHPDYPEGIMHYMKVSSLNEISSFDEYLETINELRQTDRFLTMVEKAVDKADEIETKEVIDAYLEKKYDLDLDAVMSLSNEKEKFERLNDVLTIVAHTRIENDRIVFIDPVGQEQPVHHSKDISLDRVEDAEHFARFVSGSRTMRNLSLYVQSDHVRKERGVSQRAINRVLKSMGDPSLEEVFATRDSSKYHIDRLQMVHFFFSEVYRDKENDLVITHPDNPAKTIAIPHLKNQDQYFENINTADAFIDLVKEAREGRDAFYKGYEKQMERFKDLKVEMYKESEKEKNDDVER